MLPYCSLFSVGQYWSHFLWGRAQQAHGMRFSHLWGGHFHLCKRLNRTYSAFFHQVGDHDNDSSVLLPHHPPKVLEGGLERTLGCYISSGLVVTLKKKSIYLLVSCNQYCIDLPQAQGALLSSLIWPGSVSNTADRHCKYIFLMFERDTKFTFLSEGCIIVNESSFPSRFLKTSSLFLWQKQIQSRSCKKERNKRLVKLTST